MGGTGCWRLAGAFGRIFAATIFFGTDAITGKSDDGPSFSVNPYASSDLSQPDPDQFALSDEFENSIVLSDVFHIGSALRVAVCEPTRIDRVLSSGGPAKRLEIVDVVCCGAAAATRQLLIERRPV